MVRSLRHLILNTRSQPNDLSRPRLRNAPQKLQTVIAEFKILRRLQINPRRRDPRAMDAHIRAHGGKLLDSHGRQFASETSDRSRQIHVSRAHQRRHFMAAADGQPRKV
jgi:hypothetical protein